MRFHGAIPEHDLARHLRGARFTRLEGWGHDLPAPLWPVFTAQIEAIAQRGRN